MLFEVITSDIEHLTWSDQQPYMFEKILSAKRENGRVNRFKENDFVYFKTVARFCQKLGMLSNAKFVLWTVVELKDT